jgi:hypothetical protein
VFISQHVPAQISRENAEEMGRQSQHRVSNTKRKYNLAANHSYKKQKGDQQMLQGRVAFDNLRDCVICKAKESKRFNNEVRIPKRAHHPFCIFNTKTKGNGALSDQGLASLEDDKHYKKLTQPIQAHEKGSWKYSTKEAGETFFQLQKNITKKSTIKMTGENNPTISPTADNFCRAVTTKVKDSTFAAKHEKKGAPLAMIAFAEEVAEKIITKRDDTLLQKHFCGLTMTVPTSYNTLNPHYQSIVGHRLLLVDWTRVYGIEISCPDKSCCGLLKNDRTNWSKNKTLFPVFGMEGPPSWCWLVVPA